MLWLRQAAACILPANRTNTRDRVLAGTAMLALSNSIQWDGSKSRSCLPTETVWLSQSLLQLPPSHSAKLVMVSRRTLPDESTQNPKNKGRRARRAGEHEAGGIAACQ